MDTKEHTTRNLVLTPEIARWLEARATANDRSLSAEARRVFIEAMAADPHYTLPAAEPLAAEGEA